MKDFEDTKDDAEVKEVAQTNGAGVKVNAKPSTIVLLLVILGLVLVVAFSYREMSSMRRDLYAVRDDYYALNVSEEEKAAAEDKAQPDYELVSQKVIDARVEDMTAAVTYESGYTPQYKVSKVRVLEVKITNDTDNIYSYYDSIGAIGANGVVSRSIYIHPEDNQNKYMQTGSGSLDLAPGGEGTVYIYILDTGEEVKDLYDTNSGQEV